METSLRGSGPGGDTSPVDPQIVRYSERPELWIIHKVSPQAGRSGSGHFETATRTA
jgi:hypothetical protein